MVKLYQLLRGVLEGKQILVCDCCFTWARFEADCEKLILVINGRSCITMNLGRYVAQIRKKMNSFISLEFV
jgi:hypothetical protein